MMQRSADNFIPSPPVASMAKSILVVDNNPNIYAHYDALLHLAGLELLAPAQNCKEANLILHSQTPHAAILDMDYERENIWSLADRLQSQGIYFMLTSTATLAPEDIPPAHLGSICLTKPLTRQQLLMGLCLASDGLD